MQLHCLDWENILANSDNFDITIKVENDTYFCHKMLLALQSEYFKTMFQNQWKAIVKNCIIVELIQHVFVFLFLENLVSLRQRKKVQGKLRRV